MEDETIEEILNVLKTPKDISKLSLEEMANIITLYFIGYLAKPIGISKELLKKCAKAFDENRGKTEREEEAVYNILKTEIK